MSGTLRSGTFSELAIMYLKTSHISSQDHANTVSSSSSKYNRKSLTENSIGKIHINDNKKKQQKCIY